MDGDDSVDPGSSSIPEDWRDDNETVIIPRPDELQWPVESALVQYADSIERLSRGTTPQIDPYTRGFVAGLRAATKVAAAAIRT